MQADWRKKKGSGKRRKTIGLDFTRLFHQDAEIKSIKEN